MKNFVELEFKVRKKAGKENKYFAEFEAQPLVQGFGTTLGNSLRRVLLTSVLGSAIYAFQIEKIEQEFQNLPGCSENVVQIGLNIQKVIVAVDETVFPNEKEKIILHLKVQGIKKVLAKDLSVPAGVKIINPKQEIVNIVKADKLLEMRFFVIQGHGFSNFQDNKLLTENQIGVLTVSANFSHVRKVSVQVEEIKIGEQDVSEKLILGVQTNGAIDPVACLAKAAQILSAHLKCFVDLTGKKLSDFEFKVQERKGGDLPRLEIMNLDFSERTVNALKTAGIKYLGELKDRKKSELLDIKNLGQKSLKEIVDKLWQEFKIELED